MRRVFSLSLAGLLIILLVGIILASFSPEMAARAQEGTQPAEVTATWTPAITPTATLVTDADIAVSYRVEKVLDASFATAIDWTPDGRMFYTERFSGRLRVINTDGTLQTNPVWTFPVDVQGERGLLGVAVSPDYEETGYIYVYYTRVPGGGFTTPTNRIVRITESEGVGSDPLVLLDIPLTGYNLWHQGGNIHFGPDGMLYLGIGEYDNPAWAQSLDVIPGGISRFEVVGDTLVPASNNPFPGSTKYAYGLRNPFDFDFDPYSPDMLIWSIDNGPDCDDELNRIVAGGNYGWRPGYPCDDNAPQNTTAYRYPIWYTTPTVAPVGMAVYTGWQIPQWRGQIFFCEWNTGKMRRAVIDETRTRLIGIRDVNLQGALCNLEVQDGPDGALYFTNQTGIWRLVIQ